MRKLLKYIVNIACLSEFIIPGDSHSVIKVPGEEACCHLCHSELVGITGRHGVASALSEAAQIPLLEWVLISQRIASTHLKGAIVNLFVVAVYAATLDVAEDAKDSFYDDLQGAIDTADWRRGLERKAWSSRCGNMVI